MCKVSVIIPVYNAENYIVRCAESLFKQTLDDIQFIFVDDASPDNSISLIKQTLERFPERKSQTLIIRNQTNMGCSMARQQALLYVKAPFTAMCDSDDWMESTMYADLYENALQNNADMVICDHDQRIDGKIIPKITKRQTGNSLIHNFLYGQLTSVLWNRLVRTDVYRRISFSTESILEDFFITAQLIFYAPRVSFLHKILYHYVRQPKSVTNDLCMENIDNKVSSALSNYKLMHDFIMNHYRIKESDFVLRKISVSSFYFRYITNWETRKKYLQLFPELYFGILFNRKVPLFIKATHLLILLGLYPVARPMYDNTLKNIRTRLAYGFRQPRLSK